MSDAEPGTALRYAIHGAGVALAGWQQRCLDDLTGMRGVGPPVQAADFSPAALRDLELDFVLSFAAVGIPEECFDIPRYGIWRFHCGDWMNYRGGPAGFWEVYEDCPTSAAMLVRVQADPELLWPLKTAHLRTHRLSVDRNREQLLARLAQFPALLCRDILADAGGPAAAASPVAPATGLATEAAAPQWALRLLRSGASLRRAPTSAQRALLRLRVGVRMLSVGLRSLFRHDQWNVGIVEQPIGDFLTQARPAPVRWLPATPRAELRADPFGVFHEGRATILCEYFSYVDNRGYIVAMDADGRPVGGRVSIGPARPVHLSYPYLLEHDGSVLCMPESSEAGEVALYEIEEFPARWRRVATLLTGRGFADASLFEHERRWWLAAGEVAAKGANCELHLWFADRPRGPWVAHPGNPVKVDVRSARPGGTPFRVDGALYRPAQDCSTTYGARVVINRVLALTPTRFHEEVACTVDPDEQGPYPAGLHTLSAFGDRTLLDGKRSVFAAAEFFRVLRHYLP